MTHFTRSILNKRTVDYKAMTCASGSDENIDYNHWSTVNSVELIRQVKKNPPLYNSQAEGYNDFNGKEKIWEQINQNLFPTYSSLPISTQNVIKQTVRRRWKSLRNSIARDLRTKVTKKNYSGNSNPLLVEMQFLIPHIKSIYAKVAQQNKQSTSNGKRCFADENTMFQDIANVAEEDEGSNMVTIDEKPYATMRGNRSMCSSRNAEPDSTPNDIRQEPVSTSGNGQRDDCNNGYYLEQCNTAEFSPSVGEHGTRQFHPQTSSTPAPGSENRRKRQAIDPEFQEKLLELISNTIANRGNQPEAEDEERMFMLSLVSDLKGLPMAKKMLVKAEIVTAIARGGAPEE